MAGSISLSLSQQFDKLGKPLSGGKLFFFQAGTVAIPQNAFQDSALTIPLPNPITLDEGGRVPQFYLADGQIKIRLSDKNGVTQIAADNILVIGPSSGGGGGGGSVDPTTVFQTGDVMWLDVSGARIGWVRDNGKTIGSATSGATERANADTEALFDWLYHRFDNTFCPVSGGRGANAAVDFAENKTIQLPNKRGISIVGVADMGNSDSGALANVPVVSGSVVTAGSVVGENLHTMAKAELPEAPPAGTIANGAISIPPSSQGYYGWDGGGFVTVSSSPGGVAVPVSSAMHSITFDQAETKFNGSNLGSGASHNNVPMMVLGTFYRKL